MELTLVNRSFIALLLFFFLQNPCLEACFRFSWRWKKACIFFSCYCVKLKRNPFSPECVKSILTTTTARSEDIKISFTPAGKYTRCFQTFPNKFNHLIFVNTYKFMKENHFPCIPRGTTSKNLTINCHNKMVILCWIGLPARMKGRGLRAPMHF